MECPMRSPKNHALWKTLSWAVVSFILILGIELLTHLIRHGGTGLRDFLATAGLGVLIACVLKTPIYLFHEILWHPKPHQ